MPNGRCFCSTLPRITVLSLFLFLSACGGTDNERRDLPRTLSLDGTWHFRVDGENVGFTERWFDPASDHTSWMTLAVPGSWDQHREFSSYDGFGWYVQRFDAEELAGTKTALVIDAVDDNAELWLNGARIGTHAGYGQRFFIDVTGKLLEKGNVLVLRIEDLAGPGGLVGSVSLMEYESEEELMRGEYVNAEPVRSADWVRDAVIYEVYPRSFSREGSFKAIERRLPELKDLGVTVLWMMPIHPIGEERRKGSLGSPYAVRDFHAVNPEFGSMEDFRSLVRSAHANGMRIIIDLVANHTSWDNVLIRQHPEWFTRNAEGDIVSPNEDWHDVADLDYTQPALRQWMKDMMLFWVRDVGIDGFRCDVAELVPHDFWVEAIAALRAVKPVMMLAEGADPKLHVNAFDMTYAWNTYDILRPLLNGDLNPEDVHFSLRAETWRYPKGALRLRFSSNHDKDMYDAPAAQWFGPAAARAAAVITTLLPGVPLLYNGQETGNLSSLDLFERVLIDWSKDEHGFRDLYRSLYSIRREHDAARRGELLALTPKEATPVLLFARRLGSEVVVVAVNCSAKEAKVSTVLPGSLKGEQLLSRGQFSLRGVRAEFRLPPYGYVVLR
ncbi:MAG: alpha-amylase family glycosyl hydrolase [Bacteroidia bacterium]|nr:alpha-amylase family glycosyl hydrolase [Bacteroidia bacterium]